MKDNEQQEYVTRESVIGVLSKLKGMSFYEYAPTALYYKINGEIYDSASCYPYTHGFDLDELAEKMVMWGDKPDTIRNGSTFICSRKLFSEHPRDKEELAKKIFGEIKARLGSSNVFRETYDYRTKFYRGEPISAFRNEVIIDIRRPTLTYLEKIGDWDVSTKQANISQISKFSGEFIAFRDPEFNEGKIPIVIPNTIMIS